MGGRKIKQTYSKKNVTPENKIKKDRKRNQKRK